MRKIKSVAAPVNVDSEVLAEIKPSDSEPLIENETKVEDNTPVNPKQKNRPPVK